MRLILAVLATFLFIGGAEAANRFWVPIAVTGAVSGTGGVCRLTTGANLATGKVTGETVTVASVGGATGCNVTTTITAIDSTHIELVGTTFGGAYTSGGTIAGGTWNATNIGNWGTTTGGAGGSAIPGTADAVIFDGASGGAPVTVAASIGGTETIGSFTWGAFTSTLDFDTNNPSITVTGVTCFSGSGSGARKILTAGATFTCSITTSAPSLVTMATTTNLDGASDFSGTWVFTGSNAFVRGFLGGGLSYGTLTIATNASSGGVNITGANTFGTLNFTGPGVLSFPSAVTTTITNAFAFAGASATAPSLIFAGNGPLVLGTLHATAASTMDKVAIRDLTFNTSTVTITNGYDLGGNSGTYTLANPASGSTNNIIGGGGG